MKPDERLLAVKKFLQDCPPCSSHELERLHALVVLERCGGNRTIAYKKLKIGVRTLRNWIQALRVWGYEIPECDPASKRKSLPPEVHRGPR